MAGNLLTVTQSNAGFSSQPPKTVFVGWNTRADGTGTSYKAGQSIMISDNLTLYAQWKAERYQVYKDSAPTTIVGTYRLMADAVAACGTTSGASGSSYTIVATEDDPDMNNVAGSAGNWVNIPNGKSITVKSDEGGPYVLTQTRVVSSGSGSPWHFGIASGGELTLEDITLSGTGVTSGNQTNGGVRGLAGGKLTINAGTTITKCYAGSSTGGGVDISGPFIMNGGVISNNKSAGGASGGVRCGSSFTMNGGSITGNEGVNSVGASGGGVFVSGSSALFTMNGGSITGNMSSIGQGGGVYLYMGGRMTMTGGSITGNTAKEGGGIYSEDYDYHNPANVSKYSNIAISGSAVVSGNTSGRTYAPPSNAAAFTTRATDPFPGTLLNNDNINYGIGYAVTYKANNGTTLPDYVQSTNVIAGSSMITTVTDTTAGFGISAPGFTFLGWNTQADGTGTAYTAGQVVSISGNMTLYAQWNHERYIVYKDSAPTTPVGSYHWLRDAVNACGASSTGAYTIVATENDTDITNVTGLGMVGAASPIILGSKNITLKSDSGGPYTLTMQYESLGSAMQYGHFVVDVNGSLTVENVTLSGKALTSGNNGNGGVYLNSSSGRFTMNAGATITKCYKSNTGPAGGVTVEGGAIFTMNGGSITGNIGRIGGGVNVYNATFIMTGGSIANNTSIYGGGGVGIFDGTGQFTMTGGSITNNTAAVDGGGIYTGDYDYNDPVNTNKYMRISITGGTVSGNTSAGTFTAPSNAAAFTTRATNPFPGTLLDNDNINFHFNPTVTYDANNASGRTYTDAGTPQYVVGDTVTVKAWAATGLAADTGWEIDYWCTTNDGTGTHYAPADTFTITSNKTLYAMYKRTTHDMTLSNMVSGSYADRTKDFGFTVYLANESGTPLTGTFAYTGGTISGSGANAPAGGTITLGSSGEAVLRLKHGQTVNIKDVPFGYKVRIVQTAATGYTASFRDNEDAGPTAAADTGVRTMSAANRQFDFTSTRSGVVPTGVTKKIFRPFWSTPHTILHL
ncbi:MAG: InlB B-repeat-containing protein [Christensenella sp.]|uniref:InlB B-repeat-containing protein n=1 Tax=Christensenella sp. TaxID=1935934 RepID=UPI002B1F8A58|nr:InlB B-repeat-containing protein [Christensenella sp.]MEA5003886.1 InlB B-repeat-containing protein [Christensenella sp.]